MSNQKTAKATWSGKDLEFDGILGSGYKITMSGQPNETAGSPMDLLLAGVAGCTGIDVVSTLQKMRQTIDRVEVEIKGKRADDYPMVFTDVEIVYIVLGKNVLPEAVERAIKLSKEKYCSASIMFQRAGVNLSTSYQIEQTIP